MRNLRNFLICILFLPASFSIAYSEVPDATIIGPIETDPPGHPSRNSIYSASAIALTEHGYVEEEYFIEGTANRYTHPEMATGEVVDGDHPYRTRLIVRRPLDPARFNGVVVVEWINVTGGPDKDIDWWQSGPHLVRNGYAYVAVSAQQMGIDTMAEWSPARYGELDTTHGGRVTDDALSFDIFSAVGKTINRVGENAPAGSVDFLDGLQADYLLATGHSQSASRLATYLNNVHPLDPTYDGFMVHGGGGRIRDDQPVRIFKVMAETDMPRRAANPQPDSDFFRQWEVAGSSHVDEIFELEYARVRNLRDGLPIDNVGLRDSDCELPAYSRVPFRDVMDAAFEHLVDWVAEGVAPPRAEPLRVQRMLPTLQFARDAHGNVLGGIRLAAHAVPTAKNTGMNSGTVNRFCFLYGSHEPFSEAELRRLYPSHAEYVNRVREVVGRNLEAGYILP
ncbi:MAG: alpha/beta hydrolase domain-containing protein, partial [Pseudohongiellaceae bacterium]